MSRMDDVADRVEMSGRHRPATTVVWWAGAGMFFLALQAVVLGLWIVETGAPAAPEDYTMSIARAVQSWVAQAGMALLFVTCAVVAWRETRKAGEVTFNTACIIGYVTTFWVGPIANAGGVYVLQNRHGLNVIGWGPYIPFWSVDTSFPLVETVFTSGGLTYPGMIVWVWCELWLVNRIRRARPQWGMAPLTVIVVALSFLIDLVFEMLLVYGMIAYAYPNADPDWTLFAGEWYQLPLLALIAGMFFSAPVCWVWVQSKVSGRIPLIFRGEERFTRRTRSWLRVFAAVGLTNAALLTWALIDAVSPLIGTGPVPADMPGYFLPR